MKGGKVSRLIRSLRECKLLLRRIQNDIEGHGAIPWPEIDRAEEVLREIGHRGEKEHAMADQLAPETRTTRTESDPRQLNKALAQIRALKSAEHPVVRLVHPEWPSPHQVAWRRWADVPEAGKLSMLQDLIDWQGVTNRDMAHILLGELDVGKLSSGQRDLLIRLAEPEPARSTMSLEELKRVASGRQLGQGKDRGIER